MSTAFLFPGQGSQAVGMGRALAEACPEARRVFEEVDAALDEKLTRVIWEGPEDQLTLTRNAQPALMAVSLAAIRALEAEGVRLSRHAAHVAGHSLGEYSALAAAGALTVTDAARLLRLRGEAMQEAVPVGEGAMAAILGLDIDQVRAVAAQAAEDAVCDVANDNAPGQVVVSGNRAAVERAIEIAAGKGAKRSILLPVSAPFHCALMQPAAEAMADALARVHMEAPAVPLVANVTAAPVADVTGIRRHLVEQVTATVRWRESVLWLAENGARLMAEVGAGRVLTGLVRRISREPVAVAAGTPEEVAGLAERLQGAPSPED
jgi:[acyl-carrier-protein] S-malonyltransferase